MRKLLLLPIIFILLFWSCNKEKAIENKLDYIEDNIWLLTSYTIDGNNAMDTINKYLRSKNIGFHRPDPRNYPYSYRVYNSDSCIAGLDQLGFLDYKTERCNFLVYSAYLEIKTGSKHYTDSLDYLLPPFVINNWNVTNLDKKEFSISCFYRNKRISISLQAQ